MSRRVLVTGALLHLIAAEAAKNTKTVIKGRELGDMEIKVYHAPLDDGPKFGSRDAFFMKPRRERRKKS